MGEILRGHDRVAILVHGVSWTAALDRYEIAPGLHLCKAEGSRPLALYEAMCVNAGVDDGEPFHMAVYFDVELQENQHWDNTYPTSLLEDLCNILVVVTSAPMDFCRIVFSRDEFLTSGFSYETIDNDRIMELFDINDGAITDQSAQAFAACWASFRNAGLDAKGGGRIQSALGFYHYSWRALFYDQACISLGVVLECLFSPHSQNEIAHQISVNTARFLAYDGTELEPTYRKVKKFYALRSRLVHGGSAEWDELQPAVKDMFLLCSAILRRILGSQPVFEVFNTDAKRRRLLESYVFGPGDV